MTRRRSSWRSGGEAENLTSLEADYHRQFTQMGETVVVYERGLPVDPVLFSCYAIQAFRPTVSFESDHVVWTG
jgi:hypothetical protein